MIIQPIKNFINPKTFIMATMLGTAAFSGGNALKAQTQATSDATKLPKIVNTNRPEYWPKDAVAFIRLSNIFDIDGNGIIENDPARGIDEETGMETVLGSGGTEQYNIYRDGKWVGYVMDGSELNANPSDTYEYVELDENQHRTFYSRVNIYTGDEICIKYTHSEHGDYEERYHNKIMEGKVDAEYTGPNKDKLKKLTEVKAIYKQTYVLDKNGNKIFDEESGDFKVKEDLVGYLKTITEYEYDENFNQIGVPKETREYKIIKPLKRFDVTI